MSNQPPLTAGKFDELGTPGLEIYSGYIAKAYTADLYWPACIPIYDRIYRADPEVTMTRFLFSAWGGKLKIDCEAQETEDAPETDDDKRALDFSYSVMEDIEGGGLSRALTDALCRVPLYGWGWWEVPNGVRNPTWKPPQGDAWRSSANDGLMGYRRLAFRNYSSWYRWSIDDKNGKLYALEQQDFPNPIITIPLERSLHLRFGDMDNPEGLATMEALYRLEGVKRAYETIMGIGFEHSAGHLVVKSTDQLTGDDKDEIRRMARSIMSAQPANFLAFPDKLSGELVDVPFGAGASLLEVVRYYSILKLALMGMGWLANAGGMSGVGSFANVKDGSEMAVMLFNAMAGDFVSQMDEQLWKRLFNYPVNKAAFPNMTRRPKLKLVPMDKDIPLSELGQLATALSAMMPLGDEDFLAFRRKSGFLPEILPEKPSTMPTPKTTPTTPEPMTAQEDDAEDSLEGDGTPEIDNEMSEADILAAQAFADAFSQLATSALSTPAKRLQTLEEKIKDMPDYIQDDINGLAAEFGALRKVSRREGVARLDEITDEAWDSAVIESLEEGE